MTGSAVLQDARGPEQPLDAWLALPCSFPQLDVRAWRSAIVQEQSAMRDFAAVNAKTKDVCFSFDGRSEHSDCGTKKRQDCEAHCLP